MEERLFRLEVLVNNLIKMFGMNKTYINADVDGCRATDSTQTEDIAINASDISDNRAGIEESYETALTNADDIADVRTAIEEVYELILEGEK